MKMQTEMQNGTVNVWQTEADKLGKGGKYFTLEPNKAYTVKFLNNGIDVEEEYKGDIIQKRQFEVEVNGETKTWSIAKGVTAKSLYGKLVQLFLRNGTAVGYVVHVVKDDSGDKNEYLVKEYEDMRRQEMFEQV
jgi:hypothetical protein